MGQRANQSGYSTMVSASLSKAGVPGLVAFDHRIEDGQQLAGDYDDGDYPGLAGCNEALEEGLERGVVPPSYHSAHEQGSTYARSTTANEALAAPLARLTRERDEADKRCNLLAA